MNSLRTFACSICGEERTGAAGWFLLTEDSWLDRVKVLRWNDTLGGQAGMHCLCSAKHVQELVAHWMVTGSLSYPFASTCRSPRATLNFSSYSQPEDLCAQDLSGELIGELAVHRESLQRVLEESPHSLSTILEALLEALQPKATTTTQLREEEEVALV
jgi:hypothetical protein